jgi:choline-sulfatase
VGAGPHAHQKMRTHRAKWGGRRAAALFLLIGVIAIATALWVTRSNRRVGSPVERLNVLLITIDTLRADRIGRGLTPAIDSVAARGVSFANVRATVPLTLPSHVSLMTGTIPPVHGVRENGVVFDRTRPTIARVFREAGYATGAFVGAYVLNRRFGLDAGFDVYDDAVRREEARTERLEADRPGGEVIDTALRWLASLPHPGTQGTSGPGGTSGTQGTEGSPFFLWVHLYDPHAPYAPPPQFLQKAGGHAYDGEVAYADAQVARLLAALDARGLSASTAIAITGDHGEGLGEHGEQTHGMLVYDATLRVPLVLAAPGWTAISGVPCHYDVGPGLLRLAGLADRVPSGMSGGALMRLLGGGPAVPAECASYAETRYPRRAGWHALTTIADSRWKLIASSEQELYDLQNDPRELHDVAADHPSIVQGMSATLRKMKPQESTAAPVAPDAAERLRALGYVSGSSAIRSDSPAAPNPARTIGAWADFERALGQLQSGSPSAASVALKRLAAEHPAAPVFQSTYAQALKESGNPRAAVAIYKAAVARWPNDANLFHDMAVAAREAGDPAEAMRAEQAALALDGNSATALNGLGLLHADAGRAADAAAAFERAAAADPINASYWTNLGNARRELGTIDAADAAYRRALDLDAAHADALNGLGVTLVQRKRAAEGIPLFERALARAPDFHEARLNLGIAYQESGQREKARATYDDLLRRAPASAERQRRAAAALRRSLQ